MRRIPFGLLPGLRLAKFPFPWLLLLSEVFAKSGDGEVDFAVACGLDESGGYEPVSVFGDHVGFGFEDGTDVPGGGGADLAGQGVEELAVPLGDV